MKVAVASQTKAAAEIIQQLLSPWNVEFTSLDNAEIVIAYREKPLETKKTIVIPSDSPFFVNWAKNAKLRISKRTGQKAYSTVSEQTILEITPEALFRYEGLCESSDPDTNATAIGLKDNLIILTLDVLGEYNKILNDTLSVEKSNMYRLLTGLPIPYSIAPKQLRNYLMRERGACNLDLRDKLPLDTLRFILLEAVEKLSRKRLPPRTWNGKKIAYVFTHDIETRRGLQTAKHLKRVEERYNIPSAWYVPSKHYRLDLEALRGLASFGEIGSHDTLHDGKLSQLSKRKLIERLKEVKDTLEKAIDCSVSGFRAPLLQHSYDIIQGVHETGYIYDTSIPTWEPKHPYTMKSHGVGTTYPLNVNGIIEIPVTLPQDHQMIHVSGLSARQTVKKWMEMTNVIEELGGVCSILVHPEYDLANPDNLGLYEELLNAATADSHKWATTPLEVAEQWS